ncbi:hypothetical protein AB0A99_24635 [Streptomyces fradiae]|uniref:hypothetical protein n=1 Tax=Streptomyces fradiae TaxID=1906 RepID=UPI0033E93EDA
MNRWGEQLGPAGSFGGTSEQSSYTDDIVRFIKAVDRIRNGDPEADGFQHHLLQAVPRQESEGLFCAAVPRGDGAAALTWGLGLDPVPRLPGCCGQFLLDAAQVRAALPAAEEALVLPPTRRAEVAARIRLWLDETADDPDCDVDELIDGPLRVLRHAARTGAGAVGLTLWY